MPPRSRKRSVVEGGGRNGRVEPVRWIFGASFMVFSSSFDNIKSIDRLKEISTEVVTTQWHKNPWTRHFESISNDSPGGSRTPP